MSRHADSGSAPLVFPAQRCASERQHRTSQHELSRSPLVRARGIADLCDMTVTHTSSASPPPRVLVIDPEQWPRSLLRATLRERGYDAVGTRSVESALRIPANAPERGPVEVLVFDQQAFRDAGVEAARANVTALVDRYPAAATVLLARVNVQAPILSRPWTRILRRPFTVEEIASAIERLRPLNPDARKPLD
jgi:hypothetical protein